MTLVVLLLFGAGVIFIASGLENVSMKQSFSEIMSGQPINWGGNSSTQSGQ
jgi:hypothetical protein